MKVVILQSNYIPWRGYFDLINSADVFVYYDEVKYTKNDWRNRNKIYPINGEHWLTIPISKEAVKLKISEVQIENDSWQELHYKSIKQAYRKAPYFSQIEKLINEVYMERKWFSLSELNKFLIERICDMIGIQTRFIDSKSFDLSSGRVERLISILAELNATQYISGPSAKLYLSKSENLFEENDIELVFKDYSKYQNYKQMREPFNNNVSILDLLVNVRLDNVSSFLSNNN